MMKLQQVTLSVALALSLAACGSDSSTEVDKPVIDPPVQEKPDYIDVAVSPKAPMGGTIQIRLGDYQDNITPWMVNNPGLGIGYAKDKTTIKNAADAGIVNEKWPAGHAFNVETAEMDRVLRENPDGLGAGSYRPDIFIEGRYSVFDVLRYLAVTRDDLQLTMVKDHHESGLGTPLFLVSWDRDNNGSFDDAVDVVDDPNWHFRLFAMGDEFTRAISNTQGFHAGGELNYMRIDEMWANPNTRYNIHSTSDNMTARRHWVQKTQVERQKERGFVLNQFEADSPVVDPNGGTAPDGRTQKITVKIKDIPVTANNYRSDIFQPGVITGMDIYIAAGKASEAEGYGDFSYTFWPTLHTGAEVGNYAVTQFLGIRNRGLQGWLTYYIEGEDYQTASETNRDVFFEPECNWGYDGAPTDVESEKITQEECNADWSGTFGGTLIHIMSDIAVHNYLPENAVVRYGNQYASWNPDITSRNYNEDYTESAATIEHDYSEAKDGSDVRTLRIFKPADETSETNAPLLNDKHFGWKIADCTLCHNEEKQPLGHGGHNWPTPYTDGFDNTQPGYCASCHGTNGAPAGHGELDTCFWCHDGDMEGKNHGEASVKHQIIQEGPILAEGNAIKANDLNRYGNVPNYQGFPSDALGNYKPYETVTTSGNSHYHLGETFPDPFSCLSCHTNQ